jgi:hypothetical protein
MDPKYHDLGHGQDAQALIRYAHPQLRLNQRLLMSRD